MTRLEQALRWWNAHENAPADLPSRHYHALRKAAALEPVGTHGAVRLNHFGISLLRRWREKRGGVAR